MRRRDRTQHGHVCMACDWSVSAEDGLTRHERNRAVIDHHTETGHSIEAVPVAVPALDETASTGWAEQWPPE